MEVVSYISIGAVSAFLFSKLINVLQTWLSSPAVQQIVTMVIQIRDSLPPMILQTAKQIVFVVAQALHLILHISFQVGVFMKNIYHIVIATGKSIYVVFTTVNDAFTYVWNFSDNILTPFTNWMFTQPVRTANWRTVMIILMISLFLSYMKRYFAYKKLKQG